MAGVNPGGLSRSNIGITWGHGWMTMMTLLAKHAKLIILCLHAKNISFHKLSDSEILADPDFRGGPQSSWALTC